MHKILCTQNCFKCMSVHMGNCTHKRADVHAGIEIAIRHQTLSDKKGYMSGIHISKLDILSVTCGKSSLNTFIQRTIKWEHTHCRQLSLFTFTLNSGDIWSFYLSKDFLKNIKSTCMTRLLLNCFLSWIRFF